MKYLYRFFLLVISVILAGCVTKKSARLATQEDMYTPRCRAETTVVVYDEQGAFQVPGCVNYYIPAYETYDEVDIIQPENKPQAKSQP